MKLYTKDLIIASKSPSRDQKDVWGVGYAEIKFLPAEITIFKFFDNDDLGATIVCIDANNIAVKLFSNRVINR